MRIILLGMCCHIIYKMKRLGKTQATGVFDWLRSENFKDILIIIKKIATGEEIPITTRNDLPENVFLGDTNIRTSHYQQDKYPEIFERRSKRFLLDIQSGENILFIRHSEEIIEPLEIQEFKKLIEYINPECEYKLLILSTQMLKPTASQIISDEKVSVMYATDGISLEDNLAKYVDISDL